MTDSGVLDKYTGRRPGGNDGDGPVPDEQEVEDLGAFGWLRGSRERAVMLELRKKDGNITAVGYNWIERVDFDPSEGITLHALGKEFRIKGRNLNAEFRPQLRLFQGITRHRVPWIQEADYSISIQANSNATIIESIEG